MAFKMKGPTFFGKSIRASKHGPKPMNPKSPLTAAASPAKDTSPHTGLNPPHTEKNHAKTTEDDVKPPKDKKKRSYAEAYKKRDKKLYGDLNLADYTAEAKRQSASHKKTGKWDTPKKPMVSKKEEEVTSDVTTPDVKPRKIKHAEGRVSKAGIKVEKLKGKLEAKGAESEGGAKITPAERARIKEKKLASKVKRDEQQGKKGLFAGIRKRRAARKARKNIEKGYTKKAANGNGDATTTTTTKTNGNGNGDSDSTKLTRQQKIDEASKDRRFKAIMGHDSVY